MGAEFDFTRPWREQVDDEVVEERIRQYVPSLLDRFDLEEVITPKRVIDLFAAGKVNRDELINYLATYDYLQRQPTPLWDDPSPSPDEGGEIDIFMARAAGKIDFDISSAARHLAFDLGFKGNKRS